MAQANNNYDLLIQKLDQFIKKFYVNKLIRGVLYSIGLILFLFILVNVLEYYYYFSKPVRKGLFYSFLGTSAVALSGWVLWPLTKYFSFGKTISHRQAATIVGNHFGDVKDKLLNVLQLKEQASGDGNTDLILASINQKSAQISPVPFKNAIDLSKNKKYLRYALPPLLLLFIMLFAAPSIITDGSKRLINNNENFERDAPFAFVMQTEDLKVVQFDDFPIEVKIEGEVLPNEVFIEVDNYQYRMTKTSPNTFTYTFNNVQKETPFHLFSNSVTSDDFELGVLYKPNIANFDVSLDYPNYTGRIDETLTSIGDLVLPVGTKINWNFNALNTDEIALKFSSNNELLKANRLSDEAFSFSKKVMRDELYKLFLSNKALPNADSLAYSISVIPDLHPKIEVKEFKDSSDAKMIYFVGDASDDYGLLSLSFNYRKSNGNTQGQLQTLKLPKDAGRITGFEYNLDLEVLDIKPGDEISYYFEVFDNDAVNGSKSAKTNIMKIEVPSLEEMEEKVEKNNDEIKDKLKDAIKESKKIKEDFKKLREKLLQKDEMDWQTKKELEKLMERQKDLRENIEKAKENLEENMKDQEEMTKPDEEILEKQEKIQEMFENLQSEEMKQLMEEIQKLMEELNKDEALEKMEEMEMNDEELSMELDRLEELFKKLEVEAEMEKAIEKLEELAEKQEELAEKTEKEEKPTEELKKEQEELNKEFEKLQEKMEDIQKKNDELEKPNDLDDTKEDMEDIDQDMEQSEEQLDKKDSKSASDSQKSAADKMKKMAKKMQEQMPESGEEQQEEDMKALRQLLENLVGLSFDQEDLIGEFGITTVNTPKYVGLVEHQHKLKGDFKLIQDSLVALSNRVFQIESFVTEKITTINHHFKKGITVLEERKTNLASDHQQRIMKNVNDLALMLSEVMQQMQEAMAKKMPGQGMCENPGGKNPNGAKPSDKPGSSGQESLNGMMKKMKEGMKKGNKGGSSKEFAEMAARQAAIRKALEKKQSKKREQGKGSKELQEMINQMNKIETDLVNKRLTNEMLKRQEQILTRLLKHEKAERQREYDNKRKAEVGREKDRKAPPELEEYIKKRQAEIEMFKTVSPTLKPYYKFLVEEYFKQLKKK